MGNSLKFDNLLNTRDIGGMATKDGHTLKPGLLYRSGYLLKASSEDLKKLGKLGLSKVIDFRSYSEKTEQPDPKQPGTEYIHLPAEDEAALGIDRDQESQQSFTDFLMKQVIEDSDFAIKYMSGMYRRFISNRYTAGQYRKFLDIVLESDKPLLWHCTAGKDRAGFAAIILEEILGVDRDDIMESYLLSNTLLQPEVDYLVDMFAKMYKGSGPYPEKEVRLFFSAREEFVQALYDEAVKEYGSFENYLKEGLKVTEEMKETLKEKYLK